MNRTLNFFVLIVSCFVVARVTGQDCRPEPARDVAISKDSILSWSPAPDEQCTIDHYIVYVDEGSEEQVFLTEGTAIDVSYLPICAFVRFTVIPVSTDELEGDGFLLYIQIPLPDDADLSIQYLSISTATNNVTLQWNIEEQYKSCVTRFRLTIYDVEDDFPADTHVLGYSITLLHLIPCSSYIFGVAALHNIQIEGPVTYVRYTTNEAIPSSPSLQGINLAATSVGLTWQLDSYSENRCAISSLTVDASPNFVVTYPVLDQPNRQPISINLPGLQPNTMYLLNVTVLNVAGSSVPTRIYVQTLEATD